jgi:hypothetical protein
MRANFEENKKPDSQPGFLFVAGACEISNFNILKDLVEAVGIINFQLARNKH